MTGRDAIRGRASVRVSLVVRIEAGEFHEACVPSANLTVGRASGATWSDFWERSWSRWARTLFPDAGRNSHGLSVKWDAASIDNRKCTATEPRRDFFASTLETVSVRDTLFRHSVIVRERRAGGLMDAVACGIFGPAVQPSKHA